MKEATRLLAILCCIIGAGAPAALAQGVELRSTNQVPGLLDLSTDKVTITNYGNSALTIKYLDGDWKTVQISVGGSVQLKSPANELWVAFHDGVEGKRVKLGGGGSFDLSWQDGRWTLGPHDETARRGTGLRSR